MSDKHFNPLSLSTLSVELEKTLTRTRRIHTHLGYVAGIGAALDIVREHVPASHPMRKAIFQLMMDVTEDTVADTIKVNAKRREEQIAEHYRNRSMT